MLKAKIWVRRHKTSLLGIYFGQFVAYSLTWEIPLPSTTTLLSFLKQTLWIFPDNYTAHYVLVVESTYAFMCCCLDKTFTYVDHVFYT